MQDVLDAGCCYAENGTVVLRTATRCRGAVQRPVYVGQAARGRSVGAAAETVQNLFRAFRCDAEDGSTQIGAATVCTARECRPIICAARQSDAGRVTVEEMTRQHVDSIAAGSMIVAAIAVAAQTLARDTRSFDLARETPV